MVFLQNICAIPALHHFGLVGIDFWDLASSVWLLALFLASGSCLLVVFVFELSSYVIVLDLLQNGIGLSLSCFMIGFLFVCLFVFVFSIFVWVTLSYLSQVVCLFGVCYSIFLSHAFLKC